MPAPLDARTALAALCALHLDYRPDLDVIDGAWVADCPGCRHAGALRIRETRERTDDHRSPPVSVGCVRRCAEPSVIAAVLAQDPDLLEARADAARWRSRYHWAVDFARRQLELASHDDELPLAA
jgi:hypothetical protein